MIISGIIGIILAIFAYLIVIATIFSPVILFIAGIVLFIKDIIPVWAMLIMIALSIFLGVKIWK